MIIIKLCFMILQLMISKMEAVNYKLQIIVVIAESQYIGGEKYHNLI